MPGGCGTVAARFSDAHVAAAGVEQVPEKQDQCHHRRRVLSLFFPWFFHIPPLYFCHENRDCPAAVRRRLPSGFIFPDSVMLESCMPERTGATPSSRSLNLHSGDSLSNRCMPRNHAQGRGLHGTGRCREASRIQVFGRGVAPCRSHARSCLVGKGEYGYDTGQGPRLPAVSRDPRQGPERAAVEPGTDARCQGRTFLREAIADTDRPTCRARIETTGYVACTRTSKESQP